MRSHSYLSPKCKAIDNSKIHRNGVVAGEDIKKGEMIAIWGGYIMTIDEYRGAPLVKLNFDYTLQVFENFSIGPKAKEDLDDCEMFNHSCDANAGVRGQILLVARRDIKKGEEICFDYETTDSQDLNFTCKCGSANCRGTIDGKSWMKPGFFKKHWEFLSTYMQEKILKEFPEVKVSVTFGA